MNIYVGNLSYSTSEDNIAELFEKKSVKLIQ